MSPTLEGLLISAPAAAFLVIGILLACKYLRKSCPAQPVLNQFTAANTESIKSLCVSIDKQGEAIKESAKMHQEAVLRLAEAFIEEKKNVRT